MVDRANNNEDETVKQKSLHNIERKFFDAFDDGKFSKCLEYISNPNFNPNCTDQEDYDNTPLDKAVQSNVPVIVKALLEHDQTMVNTTDNIGRTPLYWAASLGHTECMRHLLNCDQVNPNQKTSPMGASVSGPGSIALTKAANEGNSKCVKILLDCPEVKTNTITEYKNVFNQAFESSMTTGRDTETICLLIKHENVPIQKDPNNSVLCSKLSGLMPRAIRANISDFVSGNFSYKKLQTASQALKTTLEQRLFYAIVDRAYNLDDGQKTALKI